MGIDPGLASGVAVWDTAEQKIINMAQTEDGVNGLAPLVREWAIEYRPNHIVWEKFTLRAGNKFLADLSSVECIGWAKAEGYYEHNVIPSTHKTFNWLGDGLPKADSPITKLMKEQGWKFGAGHSRDALSIAVWFSCAKGKDRATFETHKRLTKG
jgi:hypothetical protein